jgi:protein SCO1/2/putative membrane protein
MSSPVSRSVSLHDRLLWGLLVLVVLGVAAYAVATRLPAAGPASILSEVADFTLVERSGRLVSRGDLVGKVWIAAQTFNCCTMSCPAMRQALHALQDRLNRSGVVLVSFSVDPARDTPESLRALADSLAADERRWLFLTAAGQRNAAELDEFFQESFLTRPVRNPTAEPGLSIAHTSRLYLIDRQGRVRGSYACVEEELDKDAKPAGVFVVNEAELARLAGDADALDAGPLGVLIPLSQVPALNATLNATSAVLLAFGYVFIRRGRIRRHAGCMLAAVGVSAVFLASYLYYHYFQGHTRFPEVPLRPVYLTILFSHVILAVLVVPLVLGTLYRAARGQFDRHRRIARWTLPIWLYVSVTGVVVYVFLYHLFPQ